MYENMTLKEMSALPGVSDLPMKVRAPFIAALRAEDSGDREKAEAKLKEACEAEDAFFGV